ncbi:MAG: alpha/beta hydrolase [Promethearchaeota archaeon]
MGLKIENFIVRDKKTKILIQTRVFSEENGKKGECAVVITHPHPLYGGSMENNVVSVVRDVMVNNGITTTTFNFRGVGKSTGIYDNAIGEQEDLINVTDQILENYSSKGIKNIFLVGYSFGSVVALAAAEKIKNLIGICLISYPFGFLTEIQPNYGINCPKLFINGKHDSVAPYNRFVEEVKKFLGQKTMYVINNADHFYGGYEEEVGNKVFAFLKTLI